MDAPHFGTSLDVPVAVQLPLRLGLVPSILAVNPARTLGRHHRKSCQRVRVRILGCLQVCTQTSILSVLGGNSWKFSERPEHIGDIAGLSGFSNPKLSRAHSKDLQTPSVQPF